MEVREAVPEDAEGIQHVARTTWHAVYDEILGEQRVEKKLTEWYDRPGLRNSIETNENVTFVAVDDGVVGFVQGGPSEEDVADAGLYRIYVLPTRWGQGIGARLLERFFATLRSDGHESVWLSVMKENEIGRSFYAKHDFVVEQQRTVELADQAVEDVIMVRSL